MKKLSEEHYIVMDDSDIKIGDIVAEKLLTGEYELFTIHTLNDIDRQTQKKITHSTQPLEWFGGEIIFLSEVKELLGVVDVEKKSYAFIKEIGGTRQQRLAYIDGYREALEDNKERKYTKEDLERAYFTGVADFHEKCILKKETAILDILIELFSKYIQSLQPTEWEVEFVDGKLKLKS